MKSPLIKGKVQSFFRSDCSSCYNVYNCVFAGGLTLDDFEYILAARGYKKAETEAMLKGREMHEELLKDYKTVNDYGIKLIKNDLLLGKEICLSEVGICNRIIGLRGKIDLLKMQFNPKSFEFNVTILEIKSSFNKKYIWQVGAYAKMLSNPKFELIYEEKNRNNKIKVRGMQVLPEVEIKPNIIIILDTPKSTYKKEWMVEGKLTKWASGISVAIDKKLKHLRSLHSYGIYLIPEMRGGKKWKQVFLGKRKAIRKTKPIVKK